MHGIDPNAVVADLNKLSRVPASRRRPRSAPRVPKGSKPSSPETAAAVAGRSSSPIGPSPTSSGGRCWSATEWWAWPRQSCAEAWRGCSPATASTRASRSSRPPTSCKIELYHRRGVRSERRRGGGQRPLAGGLQRREDDRPAGHRACTSTCKGSGLASSEAAAFTTRPGPRARRRRLRGPRAAQAGDQRSQRLSGARRRHGHQSRADGPGVVAELDGPRSLCARPNCRPYRQGRAHGRPRQQRRHPLADRAGSHGGAGPGRPRHDQRWRPACGTPPIRRTERSASRWKAPC